MEHGSRRSHSCRDRRQVLLRLRSLGSVRRPARPGCLAAGTERVAKMFTSPIAALRRRRSRRRADSWTPNVASPAREPELKVGSSRPWSPVRFGTALPHELVRSHAVSKKHAMEELAAPTFVRVGAGDLSILAIEASTTGVRSDEGSLVAKERPPNVRDDEHEGRPISPAANDTSGCVPAAGKPLHIVMTRERAVEIEVAGEGASRT